MKTLHSPKQPTKKTSITVTPKPQEVKIFDHVDPDNTGILLWQQKTLEDIVTLSGPLATTNEFQIHYWALIVRLEFTDKSIIDIAFPTIIYNYEQQVSTSHIDFELADVEKMSNDLKPLHNVMVKKHLEEQIKATFQDTDHYKVSLISVPQNTMHRHPTGVSSFSGTDLRKNHEDETGIVFPLLSAKKTPSFSSIIYNNPVKLIHTEYRVANGDVTTKEGIHYSKGKCATYIKDEVTQPSMAALFLGEEPTNKSYLVDRTNIESIQQLLSVIDTINYEPSTQFVKKENVSRKSYKTSTLSSNKKTSKAQISTILGTYDLETTKFVKEATKLTVRNINVIEKMTIPELRYNLIPLENYYYSASSPFTVNDYMDLTKPELVEQMIEMQDLIIEELTDIMELPFDITPDDMELTTVEKRKILISVGAPESDINKADNVTIDRWYTEFTLFEE